MTVHTEPSPTLARPSPPPSSGSNSAAPATSPAPTSGADLSTNRIQSQDGFLSMRFDCTYVPDSFQDQWAIAGADKEGFGEPRPSQRYSFGHMGGRALMLLTQAFDTGPLDPDRLRIKAEAPGPGEVTLWVTKPDPDPQLDPAEIAKTLSTELTALMSGKDPRAEGSCSVTGTEPLPPISISAPDDTT